MHLQTFILQIREENCEEWKDMGMVSKFNSLEEAEKQLDNTIKWYNNKNMFRIQKVTCSDEIMIEKSGISNLLEN